MLQTENLTFQYKKGEKILRFPNITLKKRDDLLILGKSGIGKTTLLHLCAGLLTPLNGKVIINKTDINYLSNNELNKFRGEKIGLVFQKNYLVQSLNVIENLQARLFFSKNNKNNKNNKLIEDLLKLLDIYELKKQKVNKLSQGQLQRLGIALAVIHNPKIILADEPTSSLDDQNCKTVIKLLKKQAELNDANLIVITHDHRLKSHFQNSITL